MDKQGSFGPWLDVKGPRGIIAEYTFARPSAAVRELGRRLGFVVGSGLLGTTTPARKDWRFVVLDSAVRNARIVGRGLTPIGAICSPSILWPNTALRRMRTVITELAEMGVADHVLESISGHSSRKMSAHYLPIRLDAERKALDALDERHEQER